MSIKMIFQIRCKRAEVKRIILFEKNKVKKLWYMYKGYRDYKAGLAGRIDGVKKRD